MQRWLAATALTAAGAIALTIVAVPTGEAPVANPSCSAKGPVLGVSRTIEIDSTGGPRYGTQQYPDNEDLLKDGEVVLTFDDGPLRPYTTQVMQALDRHCTKATFFIVGRMALADPQAVKDLARRGHAIGTHTWSHQYQLRKTNIGRAQYEIELGFSAVRKALDAPVAPFFRFPFLSDSRAALDHLKSRNISTWSIDIDAIDYRAKGSDGAEVVFNKIMGELASRKKGILLFHDIQPATAAALPRLLDALKSKGYRVVHLVPKGQAQTVAQYDQMVETEASRRRLAAATQPLAPRAVTWPMQTPAWGQGPPPGPAPSSPPVYGQTQPPPPGWGPPGAQPPSGPPIVNDPTIRPLPRPRNAEIEGDWRTRVLGR